MPVTRLYQVTMKSKKKRFLVEATSREHAIRIATDPLVKDVTIPTPLEAIRLQGDGVEILTKATAEAIVGGEPAAEQQAEVEDGFKTVEGGEQVLRGDGSGTALPEANQPTDAE